MKNKLFVFLALLIIAVLTLTACKSETIPITEKVIPQNGVENYMENEPTEEQIAKLKKEFGLTSSESNFFDNPLFHGDFGYSIDLRFLVTVLILIFIGIFGVIYIKKKRK